MDTEYLQLLADSADKVHTSNKLLDLKETSLPVDTIWLLGLHEWGNIGDLAINYCEQVFLENLFPTRKIVTVSRSEFTYNWQRYIPLVKPSHTIFLHGGGNFGDIWEHEEKFRQQVLKQFPDNTTVMFPQSAWFADPDKLVEAKHVYNTHKKLLLTARDDRTYDSFKEWFPNAYTVRAEDIVLSYSYPVPFRKQELGTAVFFLRQDAERKPHNVLQELVTNTTLPAEFSDTTVPALGNVNPAIAAKLVYQKIDEAHSHGVVVTDRLHGAVFGLLAGRPVVVFENSYKKIKPALKTVSSSLQGWLIFAEDTPVDNHLITALSNEPDLHTPVSVSLTPLRREYEEHILRFLN